MARQMKQSGIEWIGNIPEDWKVFPARYAFSEVKNKNVDGRVTRALQFKNGTIIRKNNFDADSDNYVAETIVNYTMVGPRMIIINGLNLNFDLKSYRVGLVKEDGVITSAYLALSPDETKILPEYANYLFKGYEAKMALHNMGSGLRLTLGWREFRNQPILIPPKDEQKRISELLNDKCAFIDCVIKKTRDSIEEYRRLKRTVITNALTNGVRDRRSMKNSGIQWIGNVPSEWKVGKIKYGVTKVGSGKTPSGGAESYPDEGILFLRSQNVYDTGLNLSQPTYISETTDQEMKNTRVFPDDVLLNITGGSIGRCCVFPSEYGRANVNQHVSIIRVRKNIFKPEYMHYYWISDLGKKAIALFQSGGNREGMSADAIKNTPIPIPDIMEQEEIIEYLNSRCKTIDQIIEEKEKFLLDLEIYKKSLIFEYATGKKEVPSA